MNNCGKFCTQKNIKSILKNISFQLIPDQPRRAYYKFPEPEPCHETISVEQSSGCSMETRDDTAHFQATNQGLFHIRCANKQKVHPPPPGAVVAFFVVLALDTKLPT